MSEDLVKRLRDVSLTSFPADIGAMTDDAADRIKQLERELAAEKSRADRLYESLNKVDGDYFQAVAAYRKARGL